jgi:hypothetical protein
MSGTQAVGALPAANNVLYRATPAPAQTGNNNTAKKNFQNLGLLGTE